MIHLGTPQITFGLDWIEWLILIDIVLILIGLYLLNNTLKYRKELHDRNKEDASLEKTDNRTDQHPEL